MRNILSPEQIKEACARTQAGDTRTAVAKSYGVSVTTICYHLERMAGAKQMPLQLSYFGGQPLIL